MLEDFNSVVQTGKNDFYFIQSVQYDVPKSIEYDDMSSVEYHHKNSIEQDEPRFLSAKVNYFLADFPWDAPLTPMTGTEYFYDVNVQFGIEAYEKALKNDPQNETLSQKFKVMQHAQSLFLMIKDGDATIKDVNTVLRQNSLIFQTKCSLGVIAEDMPDIHKERLMNISAPENG